MEVDFIKPFNFATASFAFKWAGKQNTSLFISQISHSLTSCNVNSLALCMSALVSRPEPLTSYLLNDVSISLTVLSLFLNWNLVGFAVRTFSRNRIVAYSENMKFYPRCSGSECIALLVDGESILIYDSYPLELRKRRWYKWWWKPQWQWGRQPWGSCWWCCWRCWRDTGRPWPGWSSARAHSPEARGSWSRTRWRTSRRGSSRWWCNETSSVSASPQNPWPSNFLNVFGKIR